MPRYFIEVAYKGTRYSGFQVQQNALTIQSEVEKALHTRFRQPFALTGSSRTDAGVHALQNYFHFDSDLTLLPGQVYNLNAILPSDIVVKRIVPVADDAHSRFHATAREYRYYLYQAKNPFLNDRAYYYPYHMQLDVLNEAAAVLKEYQDFTSFSKRNTQVKTFNCTLLVSEWVQEGECLVYHVKGNRFLRGMVRGLVGTMLRVGRGYINIAGLRAAVEAKDCSRADFSAPAHGLFLKAVHYPFLPDAV
ncbi:tRNA pseudouridine(38-40) synthase TruA [Deminuibacter soli]|uniref:tRNA pseudouridine synthase A n=1 Tax=Deminuibacter soli TaxID=2291815 RepID=A0A3E1ND28_9BACT|nr:tRNA pseudouridine(38-40) synthase TruA [Deminuibacter soli]RFM25737.1 tRNA pseudouridine(38-40) synthase TruA [Deminuibacter soli]